jgi:protein SCO1
MFNRTTLLVLVAALAAGLGLWLSQGLGNRSAQPELDLVTLLPEAREIPDFRLQRAGNGSLTKADLTGRWSIVFLGFTHCPDICPTTLAELGQAEKLWSEALPEEERPNIVFVSADPERDTPELTQEYAGFFSDGAIGATADIPTLERFTRSLLLVFAKAPGDNGDYSIDHSAQLAVLDPDGHFVAFVRPRPANEPGPAFPPQRIAEDMIRLVESRR